MAADISKYIGLVTSEHSSAPDFLATLSLLVQPMADIAAAENAFSADFDLDAAVGVQLDAVGEWVGITRNLTVPLTGVYFSWGTANLGWGQGTWKGPFDPSTGLVALPDDAYRILLKFKIAANQWDGTIPGAYAAFAALFQGQGFSVLIQDGEDMSMIIALVGSIPSAVTQALFLRGELALKPGGVRLTPYLPTVPSAPYFGFGVENASISGWGVGAWGDPGTSV